MSNLDKFFTLIGKMALAAVIIGVFLYVASKYYRIIDIALVRQLGI